MSFSPEVKATFEPAHPGEHSNFEPRHTAFTPITIPAAPPDAGPHEDQGALVMEGPPPSTETATAPRAPSKIGPSASLAGEHR